MFMLLYCVRSYNRGNILLCIIYDSITLKKRHIHGEWNASTGNKAFPQLRSTCQVRLIK